MSFRMIMVIIFGLFFGIIFRIKCIDHVGICKEICRKNGQALESLDFGFATKCNCIKP